VEVVSLALAMLIGVVWLSAAVTGFFIRRIRVITRVFMAALAVGTFVLCAHRDLVSRPMVLAAEAALILALLFWVHARRGRPDPVTAAD
jgi:TRAP-type uncharacterized transport system fused permease subunit